MGSEQIIVITQDHRSLQVLQVLKQRLRSVQLLQLSSHHKNHVILIAIVNSLKICLHFHQLYVWSRNDETIDGLER